MLKAWEPWSVGVRKVEIFRGELKLFLIVSQKRIFKVVCSCVQVIGQGPGERKDTAELLGVKMVPVAGKSFWFLEVYTLVSPILKLPSAGQKSVLCVMTCLLFLP